MEEELITDLQKAALSPYTKHLPPGITIEGTKRIHPYRSLPQNEPLICHFCGRKLTGLTGPYGNSYNLTCREFTLSDGSKVYVCYQSTRCVRAEQYEVVAGRRIRSRG